VKEGLIFGHIVGAGREVEVQHVAELVAFGGCEDNHSPCTVRILGPVEVERPVMEIGQLFRMLCFFPVGGEISQGLRLDRLASIVFDVVDADFDGPLGDSPSRLTISDDVLQRC